MTDMKRPITPRLITRRGLLRTGAAGATLLAAPAILSRRSQAADDKVIYVNSWGAGYTRALKDAVFGPFTAETGIEVRVVEPVSFAKLKATVEAKTWDFDVTAFSSTEYYRAKEVGLVEPLDDKLFDRSKVNPICIFDEGVKAAVSSAQLIYRKDKFPNGGPRNWADFWDVKKFPGPRSLTATPQTSLAFALLADGVPKEQLFPMDIDRAFKSLDKIKPHIKVWWTQAGQSEQLIKDGEVDMMSILSQRMPSLIQAGVPLTVVWDGAQSDTGVWFAAKGTPRKAAAMKFLEVFSQPKPQAGFCAAQSLGPSNPDALKFMTPEDVANSPTSPEHAKVSFTPDAAWLSPRLPKIQERFAEWLAT